MTLFEALNALDAQVNQFGCKAELKIENIDFISYVMCVRVKNTSRAFTVKTVDEAVVALRNLALGISLAISIVNDEKGEPEK